MAVEDGAALGVLFSGLRSKDDVLDRLKLFQELRWKRVSRMQIFSSVGQDEAAKIADRVRPYVEAPPPSKCEDESGPDTLYLLPLTSSSLLAPNITLAHFLLFVLTLRTTKGITTSTMSTISRPTFSETPLNCSRDTTQRRVKTSPSRRGGSIL